MVGELAIFFFFFKQKTAYEMRISDWSSDVCSSDLRHHIPPHLPSPHLPSMPVLSADFAPSAFLSEPQRPSWCALASSASMKPSLSVSISSNIPALSACAASNSARKTLRSLSESIAATPHFPSFALSDRKSTRLNSSH